MEDSTQTTNTTTVVTNVTPTPESTATAPIQTPVSPSEGPTVATQTAPTQTISKHVSTFGVMAIILVLIAAGTGGYFASKYLKANMNDGNDKSQVQVESTVLQDTNIIDESLTVPPAVVEDQMPAVQTEMQATENPTNISGETVKVKRK